jgi:hypothetical protein
MSLAATDAALKACSHASSAVNRSSGGTFWKSVSKDNVTSRYGTTDQSRIADAADPERVFSEGVSWQLKSST